VSSKLKLYVTLSLLSEANLFSVEAGLEAISKESNFEDGIAGSVARLLLLNFSWKKNQYALVD